MRLNKKQKALLEEAKEYAKTEEGKKKRMKIFCLLVS